MNGMVMGYFCEMPRLNNIKFLPVLMSLSIIFIAGFQVYWLNKAYEREKRNLEMRSGFMFRETVFQLQGARLKLDRIAQDTTSRIFLYRDAQRNSKGAEEQKMIQMMDVIRKRYSDTTNIRIMAAPDSIRVRSFQGRRNRLMQFFFDNDAPQDSIRVAELRQAYALKQEEQNMNVPFSIHRIETAEQDEPVHNQVTLGFRHPVTFELRLGNTMPFLLSRILVPILFSIFLVALTFFSFMLLYRNMIRQRRLADIKNEFISNITHELKTPIATVSVAIEALRTFNASIDPEKSKEYLDISANELQRLSLLVDKVLKLSMFEKKEIELVYEPLDMKMLVEEVTASLRLQFEKRKAEITVIAEGDTTLEGDRLHLVSVIFNLLDNALKYSPEIPFIDIAIRGNEDEVILVVTDKGLGIPQEYHKRIFEKFFRVPSGNLHNTKGYGLGLSYVAHVIRKHRGSIKVESEENAGSSFIVKLPRRQVNRK